MVKIIYTIKDSRSNNLLIEKSTSKSSLSDAMEFIRSYQSKNEHLVGKIIIEEAA